MPTRKKQLYRVWYRDGYFNKFHDIESFKAHEAIEMVLEKFPGARFSKIGTFGVVK